MSNRRHQSILPVEFLELIENHKGPARVEIKTAYRKATFDATPDGETLKVVCTIDVPGNLPDNKEISAFLTTAVYALLEMAQNGGYTAMQFDVPLIGERMTLTLDEHGKAHLDKQSIGGGLSCN